MRELCYEFRIGFGFDIDCYLLFDLDDDVSIDSLTLINRTVFVELQHDRHLSFVCHRENETFGDVLVLYDVVEGDTVEPDAALVKVNCIFASGNCQIDVQKSGD